MSKNTRIKADPFVVADLARAESALQELAALERQTGLIEAGLNEGIDGMKETAKAEAAPLEERKKAITDALAVFLKMNRTSILKDKKSLELAFGVMGFRASSSICQIKGVSHEMTLQRMKDAGLPEGIRIKEELDKDAVRGWPAERLALVGLNRVEKDQFFVELKEEKLGDAEGKR
ncbi:MAG: host-nuclease inhibitor Gam family protein [Deltaproteobacteria bacterium]|jgi:phage host-nuclease inhibitor protein Gam|nr:host-nuclease inhibitor Gam family protein [Deltaproteobacteria bacterium]